MGHALISTFEREKKNKGGSEHSRTEIMATAPWSHLQRVRRLYKVVLRLHRGLPKEIRELGDVYVRDEFRRHKNCSPAEANIFLNEWADYAINLSEQIGLRGPKSAKPLGMPLNEMEIDKMRDEQVVQLYELMMTATGKLKEENSELKEDTKT